MNIETVNFNIGEKKYVCICVNSIGGKLFEVSNAKWVLRTANGIEDSGVCDIRQIAEDSVILSALINPQRNKCLYELHFTYDIPPETLVYTVRVRVQ